MRSEELAGIARGMIQMHGLRAQAVAAERASEMQARGDAAGISRWRAIQTMICELKQKNGQPGRAAPSRYDH